MTINHKFFFNFQISSKQEKEKKNKKKQFFKLMIITFTYHLILWGGGFHFENHVFNLIYIHPSTPGKWGFSEKLNWYERKWTISTTTNYFNLWIYEKYDDDDDDNDAKEKITMNPYQSLNSNWLNKYGDKRCCLKKINPINWWKIKIKQINKTKEKPIPIFFKLNVLFSTLVFFQLIIYR